MTMYMLQYNTTESNYKAGAISGFKAEGWPWGAKDGIGSLKLKAMDITDLPAQVQALISPKPIEEMLMKCYRYFEDGFVKRPQEEIDIRNGTT